MDEAAIEAEKRRLRIMMDPALAHLRDEVAVPTPEPEPDDIWKMTPTEERVLVEYGTLADWAQDALRRSLLDEDTSATESIYKSVGMVQDGLGVWDYPDDLHTPQVQQDRPESPQEASEPDPYAGLTQDEIKDILLKEHRAKTGRF